MAVLIKRGTSAQRPSALFQAGEPFYETDTKREYIGDGVTLGGILVSDPQRVDIIDGCLKDVSDINSIDWFDRILLDAVGFTSANYDIRNLFANDTSVVLDWSDSSGLVVNSANWQVDIFGDAFFNSINVATASFFNALEVVDLEVDGSLSLGFPYGFGLNFTAGLSGSSVVFSVDDGTGDSSTFSMDPTNGISSFNGRAALSANAGMYIPATVASAAVGPSWWGGIGAPTSTAPDGSYYFRFDGTAGACIYRRTGGAWVATLA